MIAAIVAEWHTHRATHLGTDPVAGYLALLRAVGDPANRDQLRLSVQVWAETVRSPHIRDLARENVDAPRRLTAPHLAAAAAAAGISADALGRVLIAIYQGLVVQTLWDDTVDHEAYTQAAATLLAALSAPYPPA